MQFSYHESSGQSHLTIEGELYKYLFKIRRHNSQSTIFFRNLEDSFIYEYEVNNIDRRKADLVLISKEEKIIELDKKLHLGWCVIDPKSVEKQIAALNELGVSKITFIYCEYSQYKYKPNIEKLNKLLINSSSQCGRSSIIELDICDSMKEFLEKYPHSYMFNFSKTNISEKKDEIETIILGCEGGFSKDEIENFDSEKIVGIDSNLILRSETAAVTIASKLLV